MKPAKPLIWLWILLYSVFLTNASLLGGESDSKSPVDMLKLSADSEKKVNFQGIRKFERHFGERVYKAKVFHQAPDKWRLEFLEPEVRKGEILILDGRHFWRSPREKGRTLRHRSLRRPLQTKDIKRLVSNYKVETQGKQEIAGRKAFVIKCTSKYPGRPSLILWVDEENFLRLKEERLSADKEITYRVEFEEIEFRRQISPAHFKPPNGAKMQESRQRSEELRLAQAAGQLHFNVLLPKSVPRGFELGRVRIIRRKGRKAVLHLAYTDGLAQISLFEGTSNLPRRQAKRTARPSTEEQILHQGKSLSVKHWGHLNVLKVKQNHISITLISEIPRQELINMITSLEKFEPEEAHSNE